MFTIPEGGFRLSTDYDFHAKQLHIIRPNLSHDRGLVLGREQCRIFALYEPHKNMGKTKHVRQSLSSRPYISKILYDDSAASAKTIDDEAET